MRRLGLSQDHVKQLLHVTRRSFLQCVEEDLALLAAGAEEKDNTAPPGLYPSYKKLVLLAMQQVSTSAVKESRRGRMGESVLQQVVDQVNDLTDRVAWGWRERLSE